MNLIKELQKDFDKRTRDKIVAFIGTDETRFTELVNAFLNGPYRITQRAGWPLSNIVKTNPELIKPRLAKIVNNLKNKNIHDAVKRNTLRFLQFIDIPKSLHSKLMESCSNFLQDPKEPIAVRVFSMTVLANLAQLYPAIKGELSTIIEDQMPYGSAGFISRGNKVLAQLKKI